MTSAIRWGGLGGMLVLGGLLLADPLAARDPDPLKETSDRLQIREQQLVQTVTNAVLDADRIGKTSPARAVQILRAAKAEIESDNEALKPEKRAALLRKLELTIRPYAERAENYPLTPGTDTRPIRRLEDRPRDDIAKQIKDKADSRITLGKEVVASRESIKAEIAKSDLAIQRQFAAMFPPPGDVTYAKNWRELSEKRLQGIKLTEKEKQIIKALGTMMSVEMEGKTFKEVVEYLKEKTGLPIVVDKRALDDRNITYDAMVNLKLPKATTRTVLKRFLADFTLTYVMKDETILVTTPERAKELLTVRVYSVADLMPAADMRMPAFVNQLQAIQTIQQIMFMITQNIEPESWEVNGKGGVGQIIFDPLHFAIIVKQSSEMHYLMGRAGLR